jgi:ribosomal protein L6P/L9E
MELATKWCLDHVKHHLIALFCTVAAKANVATGVTTNFSNEIKDLGASFRAKMP